MSIPSRKIKLSLFLRRPLPGDNYSIERLFDAVVAALPVDRYEVQLRICPIENKGLLRRLALIVWAACSQSDVNHVTGDVNFLGLLMRRSRTLLTITDSASMQRLVGWKRWFYRTFWIRLPIWRAGHVVAISEATLHETLSYVRSDYAKFSVIPCCTPRGISAEPQPFPDSRPRILAVGTKPNKNLPRLIEALAGVSCRLVVVGALTEPQQELLVRHDVEIENHVHLDDAAMALQYRKADMVVFVSTYEGFGLPILEGQAAGRPVITSRRSPMQEVAGAGAALVDPESVDEIREAVLRIIRDSQYRATLVQAGFENVRAYTPEISARQYASVYEELFSGAARSPGETLEVSGKKSAKTTDRKLTLHILGQEQPYLDDLVPRTAGPVYFADIIYHHAASSLGLDVKNHTARHTRNIFRTLWLSLTALEAIGNARNKLAIVWQGYGTYAVLANVFLGRKTRFILNTYKIPSDRPQALKKRINDKLLGKAISTADAVVTISRSQANTLRAYNPNVAWIPFASDSNWWTPGFPDQALLASHGIGCRDYILIMGDVDRDERTTLKAVRDLGHPILRVTRERQTALAARRAFRDLNIAHGSVLVNVPFELLRELYRGARVVVVPARSNIHPAGMTSLTESMSCGRPVIIPSGLATDGYVQDGHDAFVLNEWKEFAIRDRMAEIYQTDIGEIVGRNARNTVEERINFHASARKLADFIANLSIVGDATKENHRG